MLNVKNRNSSKDATPSKTYVRKFLQSQKKSLNAVYFEQHYWVKQKSSRFFNLGLPQPQKWLFLETYELIPSNQWHFNIK